MTKLRSSLTEAIIDLDVAQVRQLIESGVNPNDTNLLDATTTGSALQLAIKSENFEIIELLLKFGADAFYANEWGQDAIWQASHTNPKIRFNLINMLLNHGLGKNGHKVASKGILNLSEFCDFKSLKIFIDLNKENTLRLLNWNPLHYAVVYEGLAEVQEWATHTLIHDLDGSERTPLILAIAIGSIEKASFLKNFVRDESILENFAYSALDVVSHQDQEGMVKWLVSEGLDPNSSLGKDYRKDDYTPLRYAVERGAAKVTKALLKLGANPNSELYPPKLLLDECRSTEIARLLVDFGINVSGIYGGIRVLAGLPMREHSKSFRIPKVEFVKNRFREFGRMNPEVMQKPFWLEMIQSGETAYGAKNYFSELNSKERDPVWCYDRFGTSVTILPDGRVVLIGGEHEDSYDPDFCIYNDVVVLGKNGEMTIYGYPAELFPPSDFHTATLVGEHIYIIGGIGYYGTRTSGFTHVHRLDINEYSIEKIHTTGDSPSWIQRHEAQLIDGSIVVFGGEVLELVKIQNDVRKEKFAGNKEKFALNLRTLQWSKIESTPLKHSL